MATRDPTIAETGAKPAGRGLLVAALMMAVSLAALEGTVIVTAAPTIAGHLGGLNLYSWVFSIYLLASTVTVPIYGKLADIYGRKPVLISGVLLFLFGSVLCGLAPSMEVLIVFRAIQGLGAGAVLPITITIIGDTYSIEERAKIQGLFSGVWGVAGIAGPAFGGLITDFVSWRWVFFINVPFGLASLALLRAFYVERAERRRHVLDYWGGVLLSGAIVCLLLALLHGGETYGWLGIETLALFGGALGLFGLFVLQESRAPEPVVPLSLYRNRVIAVSSLAIFLAGALMFGVSSYIPLFEKGVFGGTATAAGFVLAPMSLGWVVAAVVSGKMILRTGFFPALLIGGTSLATGAGLLLFQDRDTSIYVSVVAAGIMGVGMGFTTNATTIAVQNSVEWGRRGVATASTQFFRSIGGSVGVALMGAILNARIADRLEATAVAAGQRTEALLDRDERAQLPAAVLDAMQSALASSLEEVFLVIFGCASLCLLVLLFFPRGSVAKFSAAGQPAAQPETPPVEAPAEPAQG